MSHQPHSDSSEQNNVGGRHAIDLASALFVVAAAMLVINVLPSFGVGFYQDDFRTLDCFRDWGWNLWRAIRQDCIPVGFRPLWFLQRLVVWNLVGERVLVHRLILALVHLGFGWMLARGTRLLGGSRLHAAVVVLLYFGSTLTRQTIYSYVAFVPSDILSLGALLVMLAGVKGGWSPRKLGLWTLVVAAMAVFSKESGIAASGGVLLLTVCLWKKLTTRHRVWLFAAHILLIIVYMGIYLAVAPANTLALTDESLSIEQAFRILRGIVLSLAGPFYTGIYLPLRGSGINMLAAAVIALLAIAWFLWMAYGRDLKRVLGALRARLPLGIVVALLVVVFLAPYLPGRWFEYRMMVSTFALGMLFWGMIVGDALQAWIASYKDDQRRVMWGVAFVVILAALAAEPSLPESLPVKERTAERLREVVREAEARDIKDMCLVGFPTSGSFLRLGNARGVVGYESKRQMSVHAYDTIAEIPDTLGCVAVSYDEQPLINGVPLAVEWPEQRTE